MTRHFASYKSSCNPENTNMLLFSFLYTNKTYILLSLISLISQSDFNLPIRQLPNSPCQKYKTSSKLAETGGIFVNFLIFSTDKG